MEKEKGQAIFELLIFLPLLIFLFIVMVTIGNSINVSINQQKVTRRYFYYLLKGNSTAPTQEDLETWRNAGLRHVGFSALGFRSKGDVDSFAPCLKLPTLFAKKSEETCDETFVGGKKGSLCQNIHFLRHLR